MILLDGKQSAEAVLEEVRQGVELRVQAGRPRPHLAVVLVGHHPPSETYVRNKRRDAELVGITSADHRLPETTTTEELVATIQELNRDENVSGILVQTPLPGQVAISRVVEAVDPARDVDGFHPINQGRLLRDEEGLVPSTPAGILRLLEDHGVPLEGSTAVVIGRSVIVGKPTSLLLLRRNATVTICHSRTRNLSEIARRADVLVAALGRPWFVTKEMVKEGAAVVDVGISQVDGRLRGDVDPGARENAGWLSPVPGGVGPMTRAMLMWNTLKAEQLRRP